jgi:hypothetical protein
MTQGWVVNGESPRWAAGGSVPPQLVLSTFVRVRSYAPHPTPVLLALIHLFCLAHSRLYCGTILFRCVAAITYNVM